MEATTASKTMLQRLIEAPKGHVSYARGESFLLHVFWEAPSERAAHELLAALAGCASATRRDTPCVPTYFFRRSLADDDLCGPAPRTVGEHPQLRAALDKSRRGVPQAAVSADVRRRGLDPGLLDLGADGELPAELRARPVAVECTELYLDERAFNEHAQSRDYLAAYGGVMRPGLQDWQRTVRLGTPPAQLVDRVLAPMLRETPEPLAEGCFLWRTPEAAQVADALFVSLDVPAADAQAAGVAARLPREFREQCTTCLSFAHPLRERTARVIGGEAAAQAACSALSAAGLGAVFVNASEAVGYVLHPRATELNESQNSLA
eukprot:m51a1_g1665 hypothetical protein (321) ;mRNA; f:380991-382045